MTDEAIVLMDDVLTYTEHISDISQALRLEMVSESSVLEYHVTRVATQHLQRWFAGPMDSNTTNQYHTLFTNVRTWLREIREGILKPAMTGTQLMDKILTTAMDSQPIYLDQMLQCIRYSHILQAIAHNGYQQWTNVTRTFLIERSTIMHTLGSQAQNNTPVRPMNTRLSSKEYEKAVKSFRGTKMLRRAHDTPEICPICQDVCKEGNMWHEIRQCRCNPKHRFHPHCLQQWLQKQCNTPTCPLCRHNVK